MRPVSKSLFTTSLKCKKAYYLQRNKLLQPEYSIAQMDKFQAGREFEIYAHRLFSNTIDVTKSEELTSKRIEYTSDLIKEGGKTILEATLSTSLNDVPLFCMIDVLEPTAEGWNIYEIKSSKKVKDQHYPDAAFQYLTAQIYGLKIKDVYIIHLSPDYIRNEELDIESLVEKTKVTEDLIRFINGMTPQLDLLKELDYNNEMPNIEIGKHCFKPYDCSYMFHCWKNVPSPNVFDFFGPATAEKKFNLGILELDNIEIPCPPFKTKSEKLLHYTLRNETFINIEGVNSFLDRLEYPVYFFDFETVRPVIPPYKNTWSYIQLPIQYSIHVKKSPESECIHYEYLDKGDSNDNRTILIERLIKDLGNQGSVIVYYASFEVGRLKELAKAFPSFTDQLNNIIHRIVDLEEPFKKDVYHPDMMGKSSIKKVLPAFTDLSYDELDISNGDDASVIFKNICNGHYSAEEEKRWRTELLRYCKQDTYAMVLLLEYLYTIDK